MKKISLISVYNNNALIDEMKKGAETQKNVDVEYILIDNTKNEFDSAAKALNYGAGKATGDVLVFLHQDIEFVSDNALEYVWDFADKNQDSVFGTAGVVMRGEEDRGLLANFYHGPSKVKASTITEPHKAFTLDECFIACHKKVFDHIKFDEKTCDGWHLYGADLCLQAQAFANMKVYAIPLDIWHKSNGNADKSYLDCQNKVGKKYRKHFKVINTTNGWVYTNSLLRLIQNIHRRLRYRELY